MKYKFIPILFESWRNSASYFSLGIHFDSFDSCAKSACFRICISAGYKKGFYLEIKPFGQLDK